MRVPSVIFKGKRCRNVFNRIHVRPKTEAFHEFLGCVVKWTFGKSWWMQACSVAPVERHAAVQWAVAISEVPRQLGTAANGTRTVTATGAALEWVMLGYDLFCLQEMNRLPDFMVDRLRKRTTFQAARYEICVAAIMTRAGFRDIEYLDEQEITEKHCELFARAPHSDVRVAVEAKSRVRPGVLHEVGTFNYVGDARGVQQLFRTAKDQRPHGVPFFIFLDMNVPPTPGTATEKKQWFVDLKRAIGGRSAPSRENPDPFTALFATNFSNHYLSESRAQSAEWGSVVSLFPEVPVEPRIVHALTDAVEGYYRVPVDV